MSNASFVLMVVDDTFCASMSIASWVRLETEFRPGRWLEIFIIKNRGEELSRSRESVEYPITVKGL